MHPHGAPTNGEATVDHQGKWLIASRANLEGKDFIPKKEVEGNTYDHAATSVAMNGPAPRGQRHQCETRVYPRWQAQRTSIGTTLIFYTEAVGVVMVCDEILSAKLATTSWIHGSPSVKRWVSGPLAQNRSGSPCLASPSSSCTVGHCQSGQSSFVIFRTTVVNQLRRHLAESEASMGK